MEQRWNHNIRSHRRVIDAIFPSATTALDVGCGDGMLSFDLADRGLRVIGLDVDAPSIERAKADPRASDRTHFVVGDLFTAELAPGSFDAVASIAMLHHVNAQAGLRRMRELVRPGGVVVVVGFARASGAADHARALAGLALKRVMQMRGRYWEHHAPVAWPPPLTSTQTAALVEHELPGATFRNELSGRYSVTWTRPLG